MIRSITIEPVLNGFVLQVGCQKVVFGDTKTLAREIQRYYDDPEGVEAAYIKNAVNDTQSGSMCAPPTAEYPLILTQNVAGSAQAHLR